MSGHEPGFKPWWLGGDYSPGPRMQGGRLNRIDMSTWSFGQRVFLGGAVVAAVGAAVGGAVILAYPGVSL